MSESSNAKQKSTLGCLISIPIIAFIIYLPIYWDVYNIEIRNSIANMFIFCAFLSIIFLSISLVSPQKGLFWFKNKSKITRLGASLTYVFFFAFFEMFGYLIMPAKDNSLKDEIVATKQQKLSTPYYDSIFATKAQPAMVLTNNRPKIDLDSQTKKVTISIRLTKELSEEELRSIGIYYHDKYLMEPYNRIYMFYYTPEFKREDAGCYATTHCLPDLKVEFMPYIKD